MAENIETAIVTKAADKTEQAIAKNEQYSVRQFAPGAWGGFVGDNFGILYGARDLLRGAWGTYECDAALRLLHYEQLNGLWGGAVKIATQKVLGTPSEISGGKNLTYQWQDIFFTHSDFGEGYDFMMQKALTDYYTLNRGLFLEIVSYGSPDTPLQPGAKVLGLNHLDAMRIIFTGNREWPYIYQSEWYGGWHKLHYTRVVNLAESPSPNTLYFGMGKSALYDAIGLTRAQISLGHHQNEMLSNMPPPGLVLFNNVKPDEIETAMKQFDLERMRDGEQVYRAPLQLSSVNPQEPATVTFIPLAQTPTDFDYQKYMEVHVNMLALALQLDPQDIWPLQSVAMGSGQQSRILEMKANSKGPGYLLTRLERVFNTVLPRSLKFQFKAQNAQQDLQIAQTAKTWVDVVSAANFMNEQEKRELAANQIPAFGEVLFDDEGNVRLNDADPQEQGQELTVDDVNDGQPTNTEGDTNAPDDVQVDSPSNAPPPAEKARKDIDATMSAFINDIQAAMQDGVNRVTTKAGTASRIRGAIVRYGKRAYADGLEHGGVDPSEMDDDDLRIIADDNVKDSQYVTDLVNEIYSEGGLKGTPEGRAPLWSNTMNRFYYDGIASADKNGMYIFTGDDGVESCADCQRLKGQKHRMKDWVKNKLRPGLDHENFICGSWEPHCAHYLEKTTGKAKGSW